MKQGNSLQEAKFLTGTVVFTLGLAFFSMTTILSEPASGPSARGPRTPASQQETQSPGISGATAQGQLETLTWNCKEPKSVPQVKSSHLRLKSVFCDKREPSALTVTNTTNGYTAAVFLSAKGFSTDFIDLKDGENKISVEWKSAKGKTERREVAVFRVPSPVASEGVQDASSD